MPFVDWKEKAPFKKYEFPVETEQFWIAVLQHKAFEKLATFALICLITPVSNVAVERIFSVSTLETNGRNRMLLDHLDVIVRCNLCIFIV
jgi:ligand-binding SRPBCC domain-containing protein